MSNWGRKTLIFLCFHFSVKVLRYWSLAFFPSWVIGLLRWYYVLNFPINLFNLLVLILRKMHLRWPVILQCHKIASSPSSVGVAWLWPLSVFWGSLWHAWNNTLRASSSSSSWVGLNQFIKSLYLLTSVKSSLLRLLLVFWIIYHKTTGRSNRTSAIGPSRILLGWARP